jgi:hypothetical protein
MASRSTYDRRIEQVESAFIARGRRVAARRPGAPAPRAIDAAVVDLLASPHAEAGGLIRIRAVREIDFHVRHIDRLRRVALHVLAVAGAARLLLSPAHDRPRSPVA